MKSISAKSVALTVLFIVIAGWLNFFWAPMIRKDFETFENTDEVLRNSKISVEKAKAVIDKIENTPLPQVPQQPDDDGNIL